MKKSLRNFLILLAVLVVGYVVYFIVNLFKSKEAFTQTEDQFMPNMENAVKFFTLVNAEDAKKAGLDPGILSLLQECISKNEPETILAKFKEHPEAIEALNKLILENRDRVLLNNSNTTE